jgi:hypothetical protein
MRLYKRPRRLHHTDILKRGISLLQFEEILPIISHSTVINRQQENSISFPQRVFIWLILDYYDFKSFLHQIEIVSSHLEIHEHKLVFRICFCPFLSPKNRPVQQENMIHLAGFTIR